MSGATTNNEIDIRLPMKSVISTLIILAILVALAGASTHFIPAGQYKDVIQDGLPSKVYEQVAPAPVPIWKIALAPVLALTGKNGPKIVVIFALIVILGGSFTILIKTGVINEMLARLEHSFSDRKTTLLAICAFGCAFLCSTFGMMEEFLPVLIIFIPFAIRMGWDDITGFATILLMVGFGFAAATFNPFTVGVAQTLANLPLFSGLSIRIPFFIVIITISILYIIRYANKVEKDPKQSVTYGENNQYQAQADLELKIGEVKNAKAIMALMVGCFLFLAVSVGIGSQIKIVGDLIMIILLLVFLILGIGGGLLSGAGVKNVVRHFLRGLGTFSPAIPVIMLAFSVSYLVEIGLVMDTILFTIAHSLEGFGAHGGAIILFFSQMAINFFVPSGSGQAALTIPILAPLGDIIGVSRQTVVLAYQMGDGFSNMLWPTHPFLMIGLGFAGIRYTKWIKWSLPLHLLIMVICIAFLLLAVEIGY
ncbi:TIGR00366 family protein [bacterium]|nr:TIGR00366 family protein [bacterium]